VTEGDTPQPGAEEAMAVSQALLAIERSWQTGEQVPVAGVKG